ncbi:RNA polymerase factor sigma-54 [Cognatiyoonia sp. IB215182]|uniref:RNA polymerase factor sigma-54 n=1 Tax=Cognatiyoonia sp. IB215182 TaxID=3097353 RepID=UPI002A0AAA34|nr:RNA polymerase factor sigma-54 [Cognatiyoonia sp. IB215182]MDX8355460.1 RNA polymerase factor sigma-54 [Cognatiyoonia sp. IB215182]
MAQTFAQTQVQTQQMSGQMLNSLAILGMSSEDLAEYLSEKAQSNPYVSYAPAPAIAARSSEDFDAVALLSSDRPSLMSHIIGQIELHFTVPKERMIALRFAEALEPTGWLGQSVETIALSASVPIVLAERVLDVLQSFEPAGLFARSLKECLLLQAKEADILTWDLKTLIENIHLVAEKRLGDLADLCDCELADLPDLLALVRGLDPKPGLAFDHVPAPVFPPDLIARRGDDGWEVELNRATSPTIIVREDRLQDGQVDKEARRARRRALAEARALAVALNRRGDTLLRAASVLVARQTAFLDAGPAQLAPLTLEDVAEELGLHASTISRALAGRMIQTPTHALPLRAFFARAVGPNVEGQGVSRDKAMDFVQRALAQEDATDPLSDGAIVDLAKADGLRIARRTVAKYRMLLGVGSSYDRRKAAIDA